MEEYVLKDFSEELEGVTVIPTSGNEYGIHYTKDVVYADYGTVSRTLQILVPTCRNKMIMDPLPEEVRKKLGIPPFVASWSYPCIVYVPGSAWGPQNVYGAIPDMIQYASMGYVVAIVQYRDYTVDKFPAPVVDARNAVRFLRIHAKEYAIDPDQIILAGSSSGGHTAAYAGLFHDDEQETNLYPGVSGEVKGIINFFGSTDFTFFDANPINTYKNHNKADSPEGLEMGGVDLDDEMIRQLTVRTNINENTEIAPMLIIHGTFDHIVNCKCSVYLYEDMKKAGKEVSLYLLKGADHGGPEFAMPEVLNVVDDFIKALGKDQN